MDNWSENELRRLNKSKAKPLVCNNTLCALNEHKFCHADQMNLVCKPHHFWEECKNRTEGETILNIVQELNKML